MTMAAAIESRTAKHRHGRVPPRIAGVDILNDLGQASRSGAVSKISSNSPRRISGSISSRFGNGRSESARVFCLHHNRL